MKIRLLILKIILNNLYTWQEGFYPIILKFNEMIEYRKDITHKEWWRIDED